MVDGLSLTTADDVATDFRRRQLGPFSVFHLFADAERARERQFLLLQGVSIPNDRAGSRMLALVGLTNRATHFVHQLSGGEQQRTAIARALVHRPSLLIADEPTGNLDTASSQRVLELLRRIADEQLATLILVTHSAEVAAAAGRRIEMRDGRIVSDCAVSQGIA